MAEPLRYDQNWRYDTPGLTYGGFAPQTNTTMANDNRISATLAPADKTTILQKITEIRALLPFLLNLTVQERKELFKLGDKGLGFDEKCKTYMAANPTLVPGFVTVAEVDKDRVLRTALLDVQRELASLLEAVDDTTLTLGSEILMADLSFYQSVRQAAKRGTPTGIDVIYEDLRQRFPGTRTPAEPTPPTPPTP